ncbi:hypothetical protein BGZ99_000272, partial [Dissophora globulifera]
MKVFQVFFQNLTGKTFTKQLSETFTLDDFIKVAGEVNESRGRDETLSWRYVVSGKPLNVNNVKEFDAQKHYITKNCNIFIMGRLLGGWIHQGALQAIAEQQLEDE